MDKEDKKIVFIIKVCRIVYHSFLFPGKVKLTYLTCYIESYRPIEKKGQTRFSLRMLSLVGLYVFIA